MYSLTVFIYSNNEKESLKKVIQDFVDCLRVDYHIVVIAQSETCLSAITVKEINLEHPEWKVRVEIQHTNDKMELLAEIRTLKAGTHLAVWTADDEVSAKYITSMVDYSLKNPEAIVSLSKFHKDSRLIHYNAFRKIGRKALNALIRVLYQREGADFFSTYQIVPSGLLQQFNYSKNRYFLFEYNLFPLRAGVEYVEMPAVFRERRGGRPNFNVFFNIRMAFLYLYCILRVRFMPRKKLLKNSEGGGTAEKMRNSECGTAAVDER